MSTTATKTKATAPEIRSMKAVELRVVTKGEAKTIAGYAAVFNSPSEDLGGFVEVIKPGAFTRALREKQDVRCLFNHDTNKVLGRTASGTLKLTEDTKGLAFECTLPDTQDARDITSLIDRGDISQCSFKFRPNYESPTPATKWVFPPDGGLDIRELIDVDLYDVGPCTEPAYPATEVVLRSLAEARAKAGLAARHTPSVAMRRRRLELDAADAAV